MSFVGIEIVGIKEIEAKLKRLPDAAADEGVESVNTYMISVLRLYPPQKRITLQQAYGGFKSDKQRRWFFAALRSGEIQVPYHRTQTLAGGWKSVGAGRSSFIANETPYAHFVMPELAQNQANMPRLIGWKTLDTIINERVQAIVTKFDAGVKKAIKRLGLS